MTDALAPIRFLSAIAVLDSSLEGWALLEESVVPEEPRRAQLRIDFDSPFSSPPVVHIGVVGVDVSNSDNTRLRTRALDVTAHGFIVQVETWLHTQIWSVELSWLAIGT